MSKIKDELIKRQDIHEDDRNYDDPYMDYINQEVEAIRNR